MNRDRSLRWRFLLGLLLSVLLLLVSFWRTDPARLWATIAGAHRGLLLAAFLLNFLGLILRAVRWRLLMRGAAPHAPFAAFLDSVNIGYLANNLFPVRLGDLVRSVLLGRWAGTGISRALSATIVERVLDSGLILLLLFSLITVMPLPPVVVRIGMAMTAAVIGALTVMILAAAQQRRGERWLRKLLNLIPWLDTERWTGRMSALIAGFHSLREARVLGRFLLWSVAVWGQTVLLFWVTLRAFDPAVPAAVAALAMAASALGLAAPSAPAGIGTFEGAVIGALILASIEENSARSMAIALHTILFVSSNLAGLWSLARRGLSYQALVQATSQEEPAGGAGSR